MASTPSTSWQVTAVPRPAQRSRVSRTRQPQRRAGAGPLVAGTIGLAVALLILTPRVQLADGVRGLAVRIDALAGDANLGIDQVEVVGHRSTSQSDIFDAVDLTGIRTFLRFDAAAATARIEQLPWVDTVALTPLPPNRLVVHITERRPFAIWEQGAHDTLIDETGRRLAMIARGKVGDLPRLAGAQAPEDAKRLLDRIASFPEIAARFEKAERIAGRRWRLILRDGPTVELPAEADAAALAMLVEPRAGGRLLDVDAAIIDLTVLRRVTIRKLPVPRRG